MFKHSTYVCECPPHPPISTRTFAFLQDHFSWPSSSGSPLILLVLFPLLWQHFGSQPNNESFVCHNAFASLFFFAFLVSYSFCERKTRICHIRGPIVCIEPKPPWEGRNKQERLLLLLLLGGRGDSRKSGAFRLGRFHLRFKSKNNSRLDYIHAALWQASGWEAVGTVVF